MYFTSGKMGLKKTMNKKNKKQQDAVGLHSITFYMPATRIDFFNRVLKEVSTQIYGINKRTVSKYIRELIYKDLHIRGYLDSQYNPIDRDD
jgi:hypothetical protein